MRDNGPGIAANQQANIYQEFIRLKPASVGGERDWGWVLPSSTASPACSAMRAGLVSAPGKGRAFTIDLPMARRGRHARRKDASRIRRGRMHWRRRPSSSASMTRNRCAKGWKCLLQSWGCDVITAASADLALAASAGRDERPDLLLIDLHLGDDQPDGIGEIAKLRDAWGDTGPGGTRLPPTATPIVMARARALGLDVLHKPVKPARMPRAYRPAVPAARSPEYPASRSASTLARLPLLSAPSWRNRLIRRTRVEQSGWPMLAAGGIRGAVPAPADAWKVDRVLG